MEFVIPALEILGILFLIIVLYFFIVTRVAVAVKSFFHEPGKEQDSLYWLYTNKYLIWLTDNQLIVTGVLLFQYDKLVRKVMEKIVKHPA